MPTLSGNIVYLATMPRPDSEDGSGEAPGWACFMLPVWGLAVGFLVACVDYGVGNLFQTPLFSSALTIAMLAYASRWTYPGSFAEGARVRASAVGKAPHAGTAAIVCLLLVKLAALDGVPLTLRWPAIVLMPAAGRCAMSLAMNLLPRSGDAGSNKNRVLSIAAAIWAMAVYAAAIFACWAGSKYVSFTWWVIDGHFMARAGALWAILTVALAARMFLKGRGWTTNGIGGLSEVLELAPVMAALLIVLG